MLNDYFAEWKAEEVDSDWVGPHPHRDQSWGLLSQHGIDQSVPGWLGTFSWPTSSGRDHDLCLGCACLSAGVVSGANSCSRGVSRDILGHLGGEGAGAALSVGPGDFGDIVKEPAVQGKGREDSNFFQLPLMASG